MSKLDDLIKRLCPDGVKFVSLGNLAYRHNGINITASQMKRLHIEGAPVRIFAAEILSQTLDMTTFHIIR